jgi:hypothetical protein
MVARHGGRTEAPSTRDQFHALQGVVAGLTADVAQLRAFIGEQAARLERLDGAERWIYEAVKVLQREGGSRLADLGILREQVTAIATSTNSSAGGLQDVELQEIKHVVLSAVETGADQQMRLYEAAFAAGHTAGFAARVLVDGVDDLQVPDMSTQAGPVSVSPPDAAGDEG